MTKTITVYTTDSCASCLMVKKYLDGKGLQYNVVNLDQEPLAVRQKVIEISGAMTVPVTVVQDEQGSQNVTVGWNPGKLAAVIGQN